jgi:hypothetical protein
MTSGILPVYIASEVLDTSIDLRTVSSLNDTYKTREAHIRAEIQKLTQQESNVIGVYKQILRSMIHYFSNMVCIDSEGKISEVKCIYANPERMIAKIKQETNIILPIISIAQNTSTTDLKRSRYKSMLVHEVAYDRETNRATRILSIAPVPVVITYNINVWCKYKEDLDQLVEQIRLKFNPDADLSIDGHDLIKAYLQEGESLEGGNFEAGNQEDRTLKKIFTVNVETYINNPKFLITSTGAIERIMLEF